MSKKEDKNKGRVFARLDLSSRFWKTFLTVLAACLTFIGPTYLVYVLTKIWGIPNSVSMFSGFILFMVGLGLIWYLIRNKIIS